MASASAISTPSAVALLGGVGGATRPSVSRPTRMRAAALREVRRQCARLGAAQPTAAELARRSTAELAMMAGSMARRAREGRA